MSPAPESSDLRGTLNYCSPHLIPVYPVKKWFDPETMEYKISHHRQIPSEEFSLSAESTSWVLTFRFRVVFQAYCVLILSFGSLRPVDSGRSTLVLLR